VRAVGLHPDVIVVTSRIYQTNCTLVRAGEEAFVLDSPILPDELELLPTVAARAGFRVVGLLATHADWDHLLGRYGFPDAPLGLAETSAAALRNHPGVAQRELRAFDEEHYVERPGPLGLADLQTLPVPGRVGLGNRELELHRAEGHTEDGLAAWVPWASVLVCGDYLSPAEIPMLTEGGSRSAYLATLRRLGPLVEAADAVVPGHGAVLDRVRAAAILREDLAYLEGLPAAPLPLARRSAAQRGIHARNLERL
jgi:glyoxylase-like metal-dependent hydrolase (beta-lactamase superfamily II)